MQVNEERKVILIGEDDHNGLGLVRSFGVNGIKPYGVIVGKSRFVKYSKYWEQTWSVLDNQAAISLVLREFSNEPLKPVLISWSDGIVKEIIENKISLAQYFEFPRIYENDGIYDDLLNKENQVRFAQKMGLKMLPSYIIEVQNDEILYPQIQYPVILKPVASVEGKKLDIQICHNDKEYDKAYKTIRELGYRRILCQSYLEKRIEYVASGVISPRNNLLSFTLLKNIRQWPNEFGTGSFSEYVTDEKMIDYVQQVFKSLISAGIDSPIDIEFFQTEDNELYINEFNWRCSGRNFVSLDTGVYSVVYWYLNIVGGEYNREKLINKKFGYTMNEATDLRHVLYSKLAMKEWIDNVKETTSFALWDRRDMIPVLFRYINLMFKFFRRGKD